MSSSPVSPQQHARILAEKHDDRAYLMPVGDSLSAVFVGDGRPPRKLLIDLDGSVAARYAYLPSVAEGMNSWVYQGALPGDGSGVGASNGSGVDMTLTTAQDEAIQRLGKETNFLALGYAREGSGVTVLYPDGGILAAIRISDDGVAESALVG